MTGNQPENKREEKCYFPHAADYTATLFTERLSEGQIVKRIGSSPYSIAIYAFLPQIRPSRKRRKRCHQERTRATGR